MDSPRSFKEDVWRLRQLGYGDLADAAIGLCAFARAISGAQEKLDEKENRWLFKIELNKGAFIGLKVQTRNIEICLRGWPSDFSSEELLARPKMGGGSY